MSERETKLSISLQQWRGVDQRTSPVRVQDGFFVMSRGVYFGLGDNAERIPGKQLAGKLDLAALQIYQFGNNVMMQGLGRLWMIDSASLFAGDFTFENITTDRITEAGDLRIIEDGETRETN